MKTDTPIFCRGVNRFGAPCTNRVRQPGGWCGKCRGGPDPGQAGPALPAEPDPSSRRLAPPPILSLDAADEDWTPAARLRNRLGSIAGDNVELQRLVEVSARLAANSKATNTKATYQQHRATFEAFCDAVGLPAALPIAPEVVCLFLAFLTVYRRVDPTSGQRTEQGKPLSHGYLRQAVAALGHMHRNAGLADPTDDPAVATVLEGYGKTYGTATEGKDPIGLEQLGAICLPLATPPTDNLQRDIVVLLLATDPDLDLGARQIAGLTRSCVLPPETVLDPVTLLVTQQGTRALKPVHVPRNATSTICTVQALTTLLGATTGDTLFTGPKGPLTREGVIWIADHAVRRAGITPTRVDGRLPRLNANDREELIASLEQPSDSDLRDRAIITSLYWGCFRGEEVAGTRVHQLRFVEHGIEWSKPTKKNRQRGDSPPRGVPLSADPFICAVAALKDWLEQLKTLHGRDLLPDDPVFPPLHLPGVYDTPMSRAAVSDIVKKLAARAGINGDFGSHSPRAGFVTDAIDRNIPREHTQSYGDWLNSKSLDPYYRRTQIWSATNPAAQLARIDPKT